MPTEWLQNVYTKISSSGIGNKLAGMQSKERLKVFRQVNPLSTSMSICSQGAEDCTEDCAAQAKKSMHQLSMRLCCCTCSSSS